MEILYIILGWLLGILSPGIINRISDRYNKKALQRIIIDELKDLKKRLAMLPIMVYPKYGKLDEKIFIWIKTQTQDFKEFEMSGDIKDEFEKQVKNKKKLNIFLEHYNSTHKKDKPAFHFKKMIISTIDSNLMNFGILDDEFLEKLLDIKFQLNAFNEEVQSVYEYLKMTFNSNITVDNHQIISKEIENKNLLIAEKAILIVEKINNIIYQNKK